MTKIRPGRLEEIENEDFSEFASLAYAKGFLLIYGKFLDVDVTPYLEAFETSEHVTVDGYSYLQDNPAPAPSRQAGAFASRSSGGGRGSFLPFVIGVVVLVVGFMVMKWILEVQRLKPAPAPGSGSVAGRRPSAPKQSSRPRRCRSRTRPVRRPAIAVTPAPQPTRCRPSPIPSPAPDRSRRNRKCAGPNRSIRRICRRSGPVSRRHPSEGRFAARLQDPRCLPQPALSPARPHSAALDLQIGVKTQPAGLVSASDRLRPSRQCVRGNLQAKGRHDQPRLRQKSGRCRDHARQRLATRHGNHLESPRKPTCSSSTPAPSSIPRRRNRSTRSWMRTSSAGSGKSRAKN